MSGYEYPNLSNTKEIELCKVVYGVVDETVSSFV